MLFRFFSTQVLCSGCRVWLGCFLASVNSVHDLKGALKAANDGIKSKMCSFWEDRGFCAKGRSVHAFPTSDSNCLGYFSYFFLLLTLLPADSLPPPLSLSLTLSVSVLLQVCFQAFVSTFSKFSPGWLDTFKSHKCMRHLQQLPDILWHTGHRTTGHPFQKTLSAFHLLWGSLMIAHLFSLHELHILVSFRLQTSSTCLPGVPVS